MPDKEVRAYQSFDGSFVLGAGGRAWLKSDTAVDLTGWQ